MPIECTYSYNFNPTQQHQQLEDDEEEDYVDMEIISFYSSFLHRRSNDFEFSSNPLEPCHTLATSPADELFSNGKLLPLQPQTDPNPDPNYDQSPFNMPLATTPISGTTPFESCNVSPSESCHVVEYNSTSSSTTKRSNWVKKLNLIKRPSIISSRINASKSYFKSLFGAKCNLPENKISDHNPSNENDDKKVIPHRKTFSGVFMRPTKAKKASSESSLSPTLSKVLKRSNS